MSSKKTAYQKGEEIYIHRSQISEAPYNPRIIGDGQAKRLKDAIKAHGLIGTLFWNETTGNLVAGHQRLKSLDVLEGYPKKGDYDIRVTKIAVSEREEKELNVILNNPSVQGEFDVEKLGNLIEEMQTEDAAFSAEVLGFTESDMAFYFEGDDRFSSLYTDTEEVEATKEQIKTIHEERERSTEQLKADQSAEFFCFVVFQDEKSKKAFFKAAGIPAWEQYVNGMALAKKFGIDLGIKDVEVAGGEKS